MYVNNPSKFTVASADGESSKLSVLFVKLISMLTAGTPSIVNGSKIEQNQIASLTLPTSIFASEQVAGSSRGQVAVAVLVYEVAVFFPTVETGRLETSVGTPVVSMIVARDGHQLEFEKLEPPVEISMAVTQVKAEVI